MAAYNFLWQIVVERRVVEVAGLVDVQARVDLDLEVLSVRVVEHAVGLVQLDRLPPSSLFDRVLSICITDGRLNRNTDNSYTSDDVRPNIV